MLEIGNGQFSASHKWTEPDYKLYGRLLGKEEIGGTPKLWEAYDQIPDTHLRDAVLDGFTIEAALTDLGADPVVNEPFNPVQIELLEAQIATTRSFLEGTLRRRNIFRQNTPPSIA